MFTWFTFLFCFLSRLFFLGTESDRFRFKSESLFESESLFLRFSGTTILCLWNNNKNRTCITCMKNRKVPEQDKFTRNVPILQLIHWLFIKSIAVFLKINCLLILDWNSYQCVLINNYSFTINYYYWISQLSYNDNHVREQQSCKRITKIFLEKNSKLKYIIDILNTQTMRTINEKTDKKHW